jgi:hypothetical protein
MCPRSCQCRSAPRDPGAYGTRSAVLEANDAACRSSTSAGCASPEAVSTTSSVLQVGASMSPILAVAAALLMLWSNLWTTARAPMRSGPSTQHKIIRKNAPSFIFGVCGCCDWYPVYRICSARIHICSDGSYNLFGM